MSNLNWLGTFGDYIARNLAAKRTFNNFIEQSNSEFINGLIQFSRLGETDLGSLASKLNCTQDELIHQLVELRLLISNAYCGEEKKAQTEFDVLEDLQPHGITTFREFVFFIESFPEVLLEIPNELWDQELENLGITIDQQAMEQIAVNAMQFAEDYLENKHFVPKDGTNTKIDTHHLQPGINDSATIGVWDRISYSLQKFPLVTALSEVISQPMGIPTIQTLDARLHWNVHQWKIPSLPADSEVKVTRKDCKFIERNRTKYDIEFTISINRPEILGNRSYVVAILDLSGRQLERKILAKGEPELTFEIFGSHNPDSYKLAIRARRDDES